MTMKMTKSKLDCPVCKGEKSPYAKTCKVCYLSGKGYHRSPGIHPRYDEEMKSNLRKIVDDFKKGKLKNESE